jgi:hypothetical protein
VAVGTHNFYWVIVCGANVINIRICEITTCVDVTWNDLSIKFI